jgi:hypothetical protein
MLWWVSFSWKNTEKLHHIGVAVTDHYDFTCDKLWRVSALYRTTHTVRRMTLYVLSVRDGNYIFRLLHSCYARAEVLYVVPGAAATSPPPPPVILSQVAASRFRGSPLPPLVIFASRSDQHKTRPDQHKNRDSDPGSIFPIPYSALHKLLQSRDPTGDYVTTIMQLPYQSCHRVTQTNPWPMWPMGCSRYSDRRYSDKWYNPISDKTSAIAPCRVSAFAYNTEEPPSSPRRRYITWIWLTWHRRYDDSKLT